MQITIEFSGPNNERPSFSPTGKTYRGEWKSSAVAMRQKQKPMQDLSRMDSVPGMRLSLDVKKKKGVIYDPLGLESESGRLEELNNVARRNPTTFGQGFKPQKTETFEKMSDDEVKEWLWAIACMYHTSEERRLVKKVGGSGRIPTPDEVSVMQGKRRTDPGNTGVQNKDLQKYTDIVEAAEGASA